MEGGIFSGVGGMQVGKRGSSPATAQYVWVKAGGRPRLRQA